MNFFKKLLSVALILTVLSISAATIIPNYGTAYASDPYPTPAEWQIEYNFQCKEAQADLKSKNCRRTVFNLGCSAIYAKFDRSCYNSCEFIVESLKKSSCTKGSKRENCTKLYEGNDNNQCNFKR